MVATSLVACGGEPQRAPVPYLPMAVDEPRDLGARGADVDAFAAAVAAAARAGERDRLRGLLPASVVLDDWLARQAPDRQLDARVELAARIGTGTLVGGQVFARGGHAPVDRFRFRGLLAPGATRAGPVSFEPSDGDLAVPRRIDGELWIDRDGAWLSGDVTAEIDVPLGRPPGSFVLPVTAGEWRFAIDRDGAPVAWARFGEALVIEPRSEGRGRYRIRFEGPVADTWTTGLGERLLTVDRLFVSPDGPPVRVDLRVHHRSDTMVRATVRHRLAWDRHPGWWSTRLCGVADTLQLWMLSDRPMRRAPVAVAGGVIDLETPTDQFEETRRDLERGRELLAPLGPLPRPLRVVELPGFPTSVHASHTIVVGNKRALPWTHETVVVHELAHAWFGDVPHRGGPATRWWEAVAEYVSTWGLTENRALWQRAEWLAALNTLALHHERPAAADAGHDEDAVRILSYQRGALVLAGLERRVGRPAMMRWLRELIERRRGRVTRLDDVIASVGPVLGVEHQRWLAAWLTAAGPATVAVEELTVADGRLRGRLIADVPTPDDLRIEVAMARGGRRIVAHDIAVTGPVTPIDLPLPDRANSLILDSDARLPLRARGVEPSPWAFSELAVGWRGPGNIPRFLPDRVEELWLP